MKKPTQKWLESRALIACDLYKEGEVTREEALRTEVDVLLGENSGDLKFKKNTDYKELQESLK